MDPSAHHVPAGTIGPEPEPAAGTMHPLSSADHARIAAIAARAPSLHNSQPWTFRGGAFSVDVLADRTRQLRCADGTGRELMISCGAALYGVRLGMRALGHLPAAELFPDPDRPEILARVRLAGRAAITAHAPPGNGQRALSWSARAPSGSGPPQSQLATGSRPSRWHRNTSEWQQIPGGCRSVTSA